MAITQARRRHERKSLGRTIINKSPVDAFTLVHAGAGVLARHYNFSLMQTLAAGLAWDYVVEPELKKSYPCVFPYPSQDAKTHALIDALIPAAAWLVTDWWLKRGRSLEF